MSTPPEDAITSPPPEWFAPSVGWDATVPGLPEGVTLGWIAANHTLDASEVRQLNADLRREGNTRKPSWWPLRRPTVQDVPYILAMAMREPKSFLDLTLSVVAKPGRTPMRQRPSLLGKVRDELAAAIRDHDDAKADAVHPYALMVEFLEDREQAHAKLVALTGRGHLAVLRPWLREHFPESAVLITGSEDRTPTAEAPSLPEASPAAPLPEPDRPDPLASDEVAPPSDVAPAAMADRDEEAERIVQLFNSSLGRTRDLVTQALDRSAPSRTAIAAIVVELRSAAREARRYEALSALPVSVEEVLAPLKALIASLVASKAVSKDVPELPSIPAGVPRSEIRGVKEAADAIERMARDISGLFEELQSSISTLASDPVARLNDMPRLTELGQRLKGEGAAFEEGVGTLASALLRATALTPAPKPPKAPAAPRPAPTVGQEPRPVLPPSQPAIVDIVSAVSLDLSAGTEFDAVVQSCLTWLYGKASDIVPDEALNGDDFSVEAEDRGMHAVNAVRATGRVWSCSFRHPDSSERDRAWTVDVTVAEEDGKVRAALRTSTSSKRKRFHGARSVPKLARELLDQFGAFDGTLPVSAKPVALSGEAGATAFSDYVFSASRELPVVAISLDRSGRTPLSEGRTDAFAALARGLAGAAHVVVLDDDACKVSVRDLGTAWAVFNAAVRVYGKGASRDGDPNAHRFRPRHVIERMRRMGNGVDAEISQGILKSSALRVGDRLPHFGQVKVEAAELARHAADAQARSTGSEDSDLVSKLRAEIVALEARNVELEAERKSAQEEGELAVLQAEDDLKAERANREEVATRMLEVQSEAHRLRKILSLRNGAAAAATAAALKAPETLDEICDFAARAMGGSVYVAPKAIRETRKCTALNVPRLHDALVFLRDAYAPYRRGEIETSEYEERLKESKFQETPSLAQSSHGFTGYTVPWNGEVVELDRHLKWGNSTSLESSIRVYFHYDEDTGTVVVGHMPTHLDNAKTN